MVGRGRPTETSATLDRVRVEPRRSRMPVVLGTALVLAAGIGWGLHEHAIDRVIGRGRGTAIAATFAPPAAATPVTPTVIELDTPPDTVATPTASASSTTTATKTARSVPFKTVIKPPPTTSAKAPRNYFDQRF